MSLKDMQKSVDDWMKQQDIGYWEPLEQLASLIEETGELSRELNHRFGPKKKKPADETKEVADEMADILFVLSCISNKLDIDLEEAFQRTMDKLNTRDKDRWKNI